MNVVDRCVKTRTCNLNQKPKASSQAEQCIPAGCNANFCSGVGTGGSGGSMNRASELLGPQSSGATEKILGKTLRKIIKIVATRWRILRLKCTKFDFGWRWGSLQRSPRPPSWIWGPLRGRGGAGLGKRREKGEEKGREGEVEGREKEGPKLLLNQGPSETCYATELLCTGNHTKYLAQLCGRFFLHFWKISSANLRILCMVPPTDGTMKPLMRCKVHPIL